MNTFTLILCLTAFFSLTPFVSGQARTMQVVNNCSYTFACKGSLNYITTFCPSPQVMASAFSQNIQASSSFPPSLPSPTPSQSSSPPPPPSSYPLPPLSSSPPPPPSSYLILRRHRHLIDYNPKTVIASPQSSPSHYTPTVILPRPSPSPYSPTVPYLILPSPPSSPPLPPSPPSSPPPSPSSYPPPSSSPSPNLPPTFSPTGLTEKRKHPLPPTSLTNKRKHHQQTYLLVGIPVAALFLVFLGLSVFIHRRRVRRKYINAQLEDIKSVDSLQFDLNKIKAATHNFFAENKLGEGGFGEVYKGKLENGQEIAVKRLSKSSGQGVAEFKTEVVLVAKLQHKNLVKLLGFCVASEEKILVYEYLPNSSVDKFVFDTNMSATLDWQTRLKIIIGTARGLLYLHEDSRLKVIHRDLKTSNILLDQDMNPKISDFGLARLFEVDQTQGATNRIVGTYGYMAPEYAITGHYSVKSDVYSFGVIMLEIVSGQKSRFLACLQLDEEALLHRAWRLWNEGRPLELVDRAMNNSFSTEEVMKCIHIGMLCIQEDAAQRPRMTSIVAALSGHSINLPMPKPPHFFGNANVNGIENDNVPLVYTGTNTITHLYPRE